jgi:hypothetical protein
MAGVEVRIHILFYGDNSWIVALRQIKFYSVKDYRYTYKFNLNHCFLTDLMNMAVVRNFEAILGQTLIQFVKNFVILCSVIHL